MLSKKLIQLVLICKFLNSSAGMLALRRSSWLLCHSSYACLFYNASAASHCSASTCNC